MFPKTNTYVKSYDGQPKCMSFLIQDDDLLEKNFTLSDKVSTDKNWIELNSKPVYNKEFLKTNKMFHGNDAILV